MSKIKFFGYKLSEYPEITRVDFPKKIAIAFAVCSKNCGSREFIVDGQTQVCQNCGRLMFRTEVRDYTLIKAKRDKTKPIQKRKKK
jgi:hypothetical protein